MRLLFLSVLFLSFPVFADDKTSEVAKALTKVQEEKAQAQTWEGKNSDQPYNALLNEYETTINPDWSFTENYHVRVKIQQESAKELGEWPIYYNKTREEITDVQAFVETPEGKKLPAGAIHDMDAFEGAPMYSDMKVKTITLPQVNIGSIIDVIVKTKTSRKEIPGQFWDEVPYPVMPTKYARHTYIFPEDKPIEYKITKDSYKPLVAKKDHMVKFSFVFEETEFAEEEDLMPPPDEVNSNIYVSSIKDWKTVADWYRDLIFKNAIEESGITVKTLELTKDKSTQKAKAKAILEFIQDEFRYVAMNFGDHTVLPHHSDDVFRNRYGDCKDHVMILEALLRAKGIQSSPVLINAGNSFQLSKVPST